MVHVRDVAQYILDKQGKMTTWKLQKLVYYSQAWSLVWDDEPLFTQDIEAWANGPVVRNLYDAHSGYFQVSRITGGDSDKLNPSQRETVDIVLGSYGSKSSQWLRDLTHGEAPWQDARRKAGLRDGERGNAVIPLGAMAEYYGGLG